MEFIELLEKITEYIPAQYAAVLNFLEIAIPLLFTAAAVATCFFGHKLHKLWAAFFFFVTAFFLVFAGLSLLPEIPVWIIDILSIAAGVAAAVYSHKLFKVQLFIVNTVLSYIFISDILILFVSRWIALILSLICGIIVGIAATKYKYIFILVTTSLTGASLTIGALFDALMWDNNILKITMTVILSILGLLVQFYFERKELKETGHRLFEKVNKVHNTVKKAKNKIKDKNQAYKDKKSDGSHTG